MTRFASSSDHHLPYPPGYPIPSLCTPDGHVNVLQLTDLHLYAADSTASHAGAHLQGFEAVLAQALAEPIRCDLIVLTGDLVNEIKDEVYAWLFERLQAVQIPFVCIAGNHDVTDEVPENVPFGQRQLIASPPHPWLLSQHSIHSKDWQILLLDTTVAGKVSGYLSDDNAGWLQQQLLNCDKPAVIMLHHHVLPVQSRWIDEHMLLNHDTFWSLLQDFPHLQAVIAGHTHQASCQYQGKVAVYTTPSTCYQFAPNKNDFQLDTAQMPGYRWLQLSDQGTHHSWVERLSSWFC